jgi:hypothetical protein
MLVKELIEQLLQYPQELRVVTRGYEGGYVDPNIVSLLEIALNVHKESYMGPHEDISCWLSIEPEHVKEQAVYIG